MKFSVAILVAKISLKSGQNHTNLLPKDIKNASIDYLRVFLNTYV
jgi:hypothetical protein